MIFPFLTWEVAEVFKGGPDRRTSEVTAAVSSNGKLRMNTLPVSAGPRAWLKGLELPEYDHMMTIPLRRAATENSMHANVLASFIIAVP